MQATTDIPMQPIHPDVESGLMKIDDFPEHSCWGKTWRKLDYSHICLAITGLVTVTCLGGYAAYGYATEEYVGASIASTVLVCTAVAGIWAAIAVFYYKPIKALEDQIDELKGRIKQYGTERERLVGNIRELTSAIDQAARVNETAQKSVGDLKSALLLRTGELDTVVKHLAESEVQVQQMVKELEAFKKENQVLVQEVKKFSELVNKLQAVAKQTNQAATNLTDAAGQVQGGASRVDEENKELDEHMKKLGGLLANFDQRSQGIEAQMKLVSEHTGALSPSIAKVDEADDKFKDGVARLNVETLPLYLAAADRLKKALEAVPRQP